MKGIHALPVTLALSLLLAACGQPVTTPAASGTDDIVSEGGQDNDTGKVTAQATVFTSTWAGGRCTFTQSSGGTGFETSDVRHNNYGYVRLHVKNLGTGYWTKLEQKSSVNFSYNSSVEVYAWCKVDGNWVGGFKYRTN